MGLVAVAVVAALLALTWRHPTLRVLGLSALIVCAGFVAAKWRSDWVAAPVLQREIGPTLVTGTIEEIEPLPQGIRVRLKNLTIERLQGTPPAAIRVSVRRGDTAMQIGERVSLRAVLTPPSPPAAPGAYDFQRDAWFRGLGGVGFAISPVTRIADGERSGWSDLIQSLRQRATARLVDGSAEGAMAAALLTGEQSGIPPDTLQAMRDSGLAHLLSISGLHLVLVVALLLGGFRLLLALIEPLALRYPIKKWAAVLALLGAFFYLLLAGSPIPAQRAFIMAAVALLAILFDRNPLSMRTVALAAMAILLIAPESLLSASFHMSFAAVIALIAGWEWLQPRLARWRAAHPTIEPSPLNRIGFYLAGVVLTTVIAGTASGLFGLYHFNRVALYGTVANMLAVPITGFWVMPWGLLAMLLMPFGLEQLALEPMRWGLSAIIWVAKTVASWPGSSPVLPALPAYALPLLTLGGLWLCLWQRRWRALGFVPIAIALLSFAWHAPPDILVSDDAEVVAVRDASGRLMFSQASADKFRRETWTRRAGEEAASAWPQPGTASADGTLRCDAIGCVLKRAGQQVNIALSPQALAEDCRQPGLLISLEPARRACRRRANLIDFFDLRDAGTHAVWLKGREVQVDTVRDYQGERPWSRFWPQRSREP
ncbi:MAG: putative rane metal-binding protein [Alphaproteobacteria bacterium]|nr:putative rane metal-binding protein [Alphaproteobacteria bacterium]